MDDPDPERIGDFVVRHPLGHGGEARVYAASSPHTGPVAVKVRPEGSFASEFALGRRIAPRLTARLVEHGVSPAGPYMAMELLAGFRRVGPVRRESDLWYIAGRAAEAIEACHAAGVAHCDVKPSNVLLRGPDLRLVDFGIARDLAHQPSPDERIVHCSRGWAAPEQLAAGPLTEAVDVFSWGCLVAYAATGASPFRSGTDEEWVVRVRMTAPDLGGLPEGLEPLVGAALSRDASRRPPAAEIAAACRARRRTAPRPRRVRRDEPTRAMAA